MTALECVECSRTHYSRAYAHAVNRLGGQSGIDPRLDAVSIGGGLV
jgi:hypothetical protein